MHFDWIFPNLSRSPHVGHIVFDFGKQVVDSNRKEDNEWGEGQNNF